MNAGLNHAQRQAAYDIYRLQAQNLRKSFDPGTSLTPDLTPCVRLAFLTGSENMQLDYSSTSDFQKDKMVY